MLQQKKRFMYDCVRFVDESNSSQPQIREVGFVEFDSMTADSFAYKEFLKFLDHGNLDIGNLCGQGYNEATVMAGKFPEFDTNFAKTTQSIVAIATAIYIIYRSSTCEKVPEIRNLYGFLRAST